jgi:hypothetical protein
MWRERFNADSAVLDRPLRLNGEPYTIIGVVPREAVSPATSPCGCRWPAIPSSARRT